MGSIVLLLIVVSAAIGILTLASLITRLILFIKYHSLNHRESASNLNSQEIARKVLDANGLEDVKVEKVGFFRMLLFGNHYSVRKRTIFLRKNIFGKNTITALGISLQKVGLAMQHKNKAKGFKAKYVLTIMSNFSPLVFYGFIILGLAVDFATEFRGLGGAPITFLFLILGILYYLCSFFALIFTIKVDKRANAQAMEMVRKANLLSEEDAQELEKLLNIYIIANIIDFVITILKILQLILKLLLNVMKLKKSK